MEKSPAFPPDSSGRVEAMVRRLRRLDDDEQERPRRGQRGEQSRRRLLAAGRGVRRNSPAMKRTSPNAAAGSRKFSSPNRWRTTAVSRANLRRTKPYGYSIFQLDNMATLCQVLSTTNDDLWTFTLPDGRSIRKAMEFMYPYLADKSKWPQQAGREGVGRLARAAAEPAVRRPGVRRAEISRPVEKTPADPANEEVRRNIAITQPVLWLKLE